MSNYYSVQRSIANSNNGRLITSGLTGSVKAIAIFPFYLRKQGNINSWEFTATESYYVNMDGEELDEGQLPVYVDADGNQVTTDKDGNDIDENTDSGGS